MSPKTLSCSMLLAVWCATAPLACQAAQGFPELSPLPGTGMLAPAQDPEHFTFLVAGDNRPGKEKDPPTDIIVRFFGKKVAKHAPALVMLAGDTIYGKNPGSEATVRAEYRDFLAVARRGGVPVFNAPGNHEMDDADDVPNAQMQQWYAQYMGQAYGAFDYGHAHFIAINSEEVAAPDIERAARVPADGGGRMFDPGYISPAQLAALEQDLEANRDKAQVFIFMHHPVKPANPKNGLDPKIAVPLAALFSRFPNIAYVIAAHEHLYFNAQTGDGSAPPNWQPGQPPVYLVSGGAGARLTKHPEPGVARYHYLAFTVSGQEVKVSLQDIEAGAE